MDVRTLLINQHALAHSGLAIPGALQAVLWNTGKPINDAAWGRVTEEQARLEEPGHNSISWVLWHLARAEDMGVNAVVRGVPEVFDRDGWIERLRVRRRDVGTGWTAADTAELSAAIDLEQLRAYRDAVGRETLTWLGEADLSVLDEAVEERARAGFSQDFTPLGAERIWPLFAANTKAWAFVRLALWHNYFHLFEAGHLMQRAGINVIAPGP